MTSRKKSNHRFMSTMIIVLASAGAFTLGASVAGEDPPAQITTTTATTDTTNLEAIMHATIDKITKANVYIQIRTLEDEIRAGSAAVIYQDDENYYAITNFHVVADVGSALEATVMTSDGVVSSFEILDASVGQELALIAFPKADRSAIEPLRIDTESFFDVDDTVIAIGNPLGAIGSITVGKITDFVLIRQLDLEYDTIAHDAAIAAGSSGGALVDLYGNLLGINTWSLDGVMYAIRFESIQSFIAHQELQ